MELLVFVLNREELLDDVLSALIEAGVPGATVVDSEGGGKLLAYEAPLFMGFRDLMRGEKPYNRTIFSVIEDEETVLAAMRAIEEVCGDLDQPGTGILFTVPVKRCKGLARGL